MQKKGSLKPRRSALPITILRLDPRHDVGSAKSPDRVPAEIEIRTQFAIRGRRLTARQLAEGVHVSISHALAALSEMMARGLTRCNEVDPTTESIWYLDQEKPQTTATVNNSRIGN